MLVLTKNERIVLNAVRKKLASTPRDLEELMPNDLSAKETRVAVQSLLLKGVLETNFRLKLVVNKKCEQSAEEKESTYERAPTVWFQDEDLED